MNDHELITASMDSNIEDALHAVVETLDVIELWTSLAEDETSNPPKDTADLIDNIITGIRREIRLRLDPPDPSKCMINKAGA